MASKVTFNPTTRRIEVTLAPDVDGLIPIDVQIDLYSDGKEDWLADATLNKMRFPIRPIGGDTIPGGILGDTYILENGWRIQPYEGNHTLAITGNIFPETEPLVVPTIGAYRTRVNERVSTLVEIVETGVSGLTGSESTALINIDSNVSTIQTDLATLLTNQDLTVEQAAAERTTDPVSGILILRNTVVMRRWEAAIWENAAGTTPYKGEGLEKVDQLVEVAWS